MTLERIRHYGLSVLSWHSFKIWNFFSFATSLLTSTDIKIAITLQGQRIWWSNFQNFLIWVSYNHSRNLKEFKIFDLAPIGWSTMEWTDVNQSILASERRSSNIVPKICLFPKIYVKIYFWWSTHLCMSLFPSICQVPYLRNRTSSDINFGIHM